MYTNNLKVIISEGSLKGLTPDYVMLAFIIPVFILTFYSSELLRKHRSSSRDIDEEDNFGRKFFLTSIAIIILLGANMLVNSFFNPPAIIKDVSNGQIVATGNMWELQEAVNKSSKTPKQSKQFGISVDIEDYLNKKKSDQSQQQDNPPKTT